jgi:hypothetical protein
MSNHRSLVTYIADRLADIGRVKMKKIIILALVAVSFALAAAVVWTHYSYIRNLEAALESKEDVVGLDKKDVFAKFGMPAAWGALAKEGDGSRRREVLLYATWSKDVVIVLLDDKVIEVKYKTVRRDALKQAKVMVNPKSLFAALSRLMTGKTEIVLH